MLAVTDIDRYTVYIKAQAISAVILPNRNMPFSEGAILYGPEVAWLSTYRLHR